MRKKSHIALANYVLASEGMSLLNAHKGALRFGSILPDCVPSFVTRRHCIDETFFILKKELTLLIEDYDYTQGINKYFCRHLGIVLHYVADYFTFPHNTFYPGNLRDHCSYEEDLKQYLRTYVKTPAAQKSRQLHRTPCSVEALCDTILQAHKRYALSNHSVENDSSFIVAISHYITDSIMCIAEEEMCMSFAAVS